MSSPSFPTPLVCTIRDAQARLGGVSRTFVYGLLSDGRLEAIKVGRRRLVIAESIQRLVSDGRQKAA